MRSRCLDIGQGPVKGCLNYCKVANLTKKGNLTKFANLVRINQGVGEYSSEMASCMHL